MSVIRFERSGPRVLVVLQNLDYRAVGGTPAQVENVRDSFALVRAGGPSRRGRRERPACSPTPRRSSCAMQPMSKAGCGRQTRAPFVLMATRSAFYPSRMKAFPQNTEIETIATFAADDPGLITRHARRPRIHLAHYHSFLKAPEGYSRGR